MNYTVAVLLAFLAHFSPPAIVGRFVGGATVIPARYACRFKEVFPQFMTIATLVYWLIVMLTAGSAILVVAARNILHAAFALCLTFLGVGAIYVYLHADFVAAVQLIVYVGGILVLIMFAIMFSSNVVEDTAEHRGGYLAMGAGAIAAGAIFIAIFLIANRLSGPLDKVNTHASAVYAQTVSVQPGQLGIGHYLMGQYLVPFELASVLLLAALIGAVVVVRKELSNTA
jgi:NAD(P)H-quinone oxidoreductase subunit 6